MTTSEIYKLSVTALKDVFWMAGLNTSFLKGLLWRSNVLVHF